MSDPLRQAEQISAATGLPALEILGILLRTSAHRPAGAPMRTIDLSPAMIGKTIRIDRPGIVGTHNHIEGELEDFSIEIDEITNLAGGTWRRTLTGITATIAGLDIRLTGTEPLTITS